MTTTAFREVIDLIGQDARWVFSLAWRPCESLEYGLSAESFAATNEQWGEAHPGYGMTVPRFGMWPDINLREKVHPCEESR